MNLSYSVLLDLKVDASDVNPAHEDDSLMTLMRSSLMLLMSNCLFHQHL